MIPEVQELHFIHLSFHVNWLGEIRLIKLIYLHRDRFLHRGSPKVLI